MDVAREFDVLYHLVLSHTRASSLSRTHSVSLCVLFIHSFIGFFPGFFDFDDVNACEFSHQTIDILNCMHFGRATEQNE